MKPSRFTIELDIDGSKYLYNSLSNAYAKIDEDHYETYLKIKNNDTDYDEKMSIDLYNGGFVINDNEDEIGYMNFFEKVMRYGSSSLGLTIAPTLQCNFRCKYCYEIHENLFMSDDVQKLLIEFVTKNISRYKNISVSWYGGEPLLALSIIRDLSKRLIKIAEANNVIYESGIISNGYLLTKSVAQILKDECKISSVQITLDGIREIHDINRPLENGQGTFDVIFQNLRNIIEILNVSIRINISKDNYQQLFQLLDILNDEGILDKIHIYIAPVSSVENTESKKIQYMCLNKSDFADIEIEFIKYLIEKKLI
ncbi:radical SAM protein [Thermoanaerobacterium thermosaccharolyticum]|uniref:radical SAM protein n=1 Tax=Thermoanaerobacterium thermosaccharolyticum TaxID=1517 RepID=UPI0001B0DB9B|nr:radical SAM protein [Thermoanaerobacterium thermosaccharolyticum]